MPTRVYRPEEVRAVASRNKLRQYPGVNKGRDRLLPYARPRILGDTRFREDASFFVVGNCFGRNLEKALARAGRTVLSSPTDLDLPGTAKEQYNRFNIFNLDVFGNEIAWAIDPDAGDIDDALIEVGTEWVDMQIHWTFAHDRDTARAYRRTYNSSYGAIRDADVVVVAVAGIEQWFDRERGIYLNGMPTAKMTAQAPDRYEFHRLGVEDCAASLRRVCRLILTHGKPGVQILVAVSPVSQPVVHGFSDALVDQHLAKSIQRAATEIVCEEFSEVEYLPALETAVLSDFRYGFLENSLNHTNQCLANRVMAEMLAHYEGPSAGQALLSALGHAEAHALGSDPEAVAQIVETFLADGGCSNDELDQFYFVALAQLGRHSEAVDHLLGRFELDAVEDIEKTRHRLFNLARGRSSDRQVERLRALVERHDWDPELLSGLQPTFAASVEASVLQQIGASFAAEDYPSVIEQCEDLMTGESPPAEPDRDKLVNFWVQSYLRIGRHSDAIDILLGLALGDDGVTARQKKLLVNLSMSHANRARIDALVRACGPLLDAEEKARIDARLAVLNRWAERDDTRDGPGERDQAA